MERSVLGNVITNYVHYFAFCYILHSALGIFHTEWQQSSKYHIQQLNRMETM